MPVVPPSPEIPVQDVAVKPSVCARLQSGVGPGPGRCGHLLCLFPGQPSIVIQRVTLEKQRLRLTPPLGKMLRLWPIGSEYNWLLCAWGGGLQHFSFPWMCALCVHIQAAVSEAQACCEQGLEAPAVME